MNVQRWNHDKPHRCPQCHRVVVRNRTLRPWRVYRCHWCIVKFAGWPRTANYLDRWLW